jgi:hypothetical protein
MVHRIATDAEPGPRTGAGAGTDADADIIDTTATEVPPTPGSGTLRPCRTPPAASQWKEGTAARVWHRRMRTALPAANRIQR